MSIWGRYDGDLPRKRQGKFFHVSLHMRIYSCSSATNSVTIGILLWVFSHPQLFQLGDKTDVYNYKRKWNSRQRSTVQMTNRWSKIKTILESGECSEFLLLCKPTTYVAQSISNGMESLENRRNTSYGLWFFLPSQLKLARKCSFYRLQLFVEHQTVHENVWIDSTRLTAALNTLSEAELPRCWILLEKVLRKQHAPGWLVNSEQFSIGCCQLPQPNFYRGLPGWLWTTTNRPDWRVWSHVLFNSSHAVPVKLAHWPKWSTAVKPDAWTNSCHGQWLKDFWGSRRIPNPR